MVVFEQNVKQSLIKIINETEEEFDDGCSPDNVECIMTVNSKDVWSFEMTHPSYVSLRLGTNDERLGGLMVAFGRESKILDFKGFTIDQIAHLVTIIIEEYYN